MALLRRDKNLQSSMRGSRIMAAIGIGIAVGCVFAFLFPHGFFSTNQPIQVRRVSDSNSEVHNLFLLSFYFNSLIAIDFALVWTFSLHANVLKQVSVRDF